MHKYREASKHIHSIFHTFTDIVEPISLDDTYIWEVNEFGELINITDVGRVKIAHNSNCHKRAVEKELLDGIILNSEIYLKSLHTPNRQVLGYDWKIDEEQINSLSVDVSIYSVNNIIIAEQNYKFDSNNLDDVMTPVFFEKSDELEKSIIKVKVDYKETNQKETDMIYKINY